MPKSASLSQLELLVAGLYIYIQYTRILQYCCGGLTGPEHLLQDFCVRIPGSDWIQPVSPMAKKVLPQHLGKPKMKMYLAMELIQRHIKGAKFQDRPVLVLLQDEGIVGFKDLGWLLLLCFLMAICRRLSAGLSRLGSWRAVCIPSTLQIQIAS